MMMNKPYQMTRDEFVSDLAARDPKMPGGISIYETDEDRETAWFMAIEEAIEDGETDIPAASLRAFATKPTDWASR
jgi:hypothetical protein